MSLPQLVVDRALDTPMHVPCAPPSKRAPSHDREHPSDEDYAHSLLARIADGDAAALGLFYPLTVARLVGIARAILKNRADVEEVVADVYWYLWRNAGQFDSERGSVTAWLMVVCRSRAIDRLRSQQGKGMHLPTAVDTLSQDLVARDCPTDLLQALERDSALHRTIAQLSPIRRQLLSLAFFEGLTHTEIAATTHLALGTVKSHLRRALQAIRTVLPPTP